MTNEKIMVGINDEVFELKGQALQDFLEQRAKDAAEHNAFLTKQAERETKLDSAITKLKALGLTESEAKIIIGLE